MRKLCNNMSKNCNKELGDYQTPSEFALRVCQYLKFEQNIRPNYIIEPTFGKGAFIEASLETFPNLEGVYGVELNKDYYASTTSNKNIAMLNNTYLYNDNIFSHKINDSFKAQIQNSDLLIVGNPPWVNNSTLGGFESENLPQKSNFKQSKGLEAIMGSSNFDISEYIFMHILSMFRLYRGSVAMLLKSSVARRIIQDYDKYVNMPSLSHIKILDFNGKSVFNINCKASLFVARFGYEDDRHRADVYDFDTLKLNSQLGWIDKKFTYNLKKYKLSKIIEGHSQLTWRQGVKHDCSKIAVLNPTDRSNIYRNGLGDDVVIENKFVYDLLKSSDLKTFEIKSARKKVILTQKRVGEDTSKLKELSPLLWNYLTKHFYYFEKRRSKIYEGSPSFSIFGIGDYSFKSYKVAISGFYKKPRFSLIHPIKGKPAMLDDTCYFIGFDNYKHALITTALLNSGLVRDFLSSQAFSGSKRPYTKRLLMRVDILRVAEELAYVGVAEMLKNYNISLLITEYDFIEYLTLLKASAI